MKIYDTRQAAQELNMSVDTIRHAINSGRLKASKFGKAYMIKEKDLRDYAKYREENGYDYDE